MGSVSALGERTLLNLIVTGEWEVDRQGRIWRTKVRKGLKAGGSHLVPCLRRRAEKRNPDQYLMVRAMVAGRRVCAMAHRLVWQITHGDIPIGNEINHRNGIRDDNRPDNLLCGTAGDNIKHAHASGLKDQFGQKNPNYLLSDNEVAQIRLAYEQGGYTMKQLAGRFGVAHQTISRIVKGKRRSKQGGPFHDRDFRHCASGRDPITGRFTPGTPTPTPAGIPSPAPESRDDP